MDSAKFKALSNLSYLEGYCRDDPMSLKRINELKAYIENLTD